MGAASDAKKKENKDEKQEGKDKSTLAMVSMCILVILVVFLLLGVVIFFVRKEQIKGILFTNKVVPLSFDLNLF